MLITKAKITIEALTVALTTNGAAPPSGSGSSPKLVLPGVYFAGIITILVKIRSSGFASHFLRSRERKHGEPG
jgi:hypothetical protein